MVDENQILLHRKIDLIAELLIEILKENSPRTSLTYYNLYEELEKETMRLNNEGK